MESDDGTVKEDSAMGQWGKFYVEGGKKLGNSFTVLEDGTQRKAMEEAGFVDIGEFNFKVSKWVKNDTTLPPLGVPPDCVGRFWLRASGHIADEQFY